MRKFYSSFLFFVLVFISLCCVGCGNASSANNYYGNINSTSLIVFLIIIIIVVLMSIVLSRLIIMNTVYEIAKKKNLSAEIWMWVSLLCGIVALLCVAFIPEYEEENYDKDIAMKEEKELPR